MQSGSEDFEAFVAARYASLVRAAFVLTGDRHLAEDLVQATLLRCYPAWSRGAPEHPEAYVRTAMVRLALRGARRRWNREVPTASLPETSALDATTDVDGATAINAALGSLSLNHRAVVVLRYLAGMSEAETAVVLRCSLGTVKSRTSRALAALRDSGLLTDPTEATHD